MIGQPRIATELELIGKESAEHRFDDQQPKLKMLKGKDYNFSFKSSNISEEKS